jgi:hypothetical protein
MHEKEIRRLAYKQLKVAPGFRRLKRKQKQIVAKEILDNVMKEYNFNKEVETKLNELTTTIDIEAMRGLMTLADMQSLIEYTQRKIIKMPTTMLSKHLKDPELLFIYDLLDNSILNKLLAWEGYTPSQHVLFPCQLFRAELLKSLKFPELSYRRFCEEQVKPRSQSANRVFIGLPLNRNQKITHGQLSTFRKHLEFRQLCNLTVYIICLLFQSKAFDHSYRLAGIDSTDLATFCSPHPLATIELPNGKKIKIYNELDADCGKRRKKRDKSEFFVGYRLHTLTAINPKTGQICPLLTLAAPANHHDSLFTEQLVTWAQAIGLELNLVVADDAYGVPSTTEAIYTKHKVRVVTPPRPKVAVPEHVAEAGQHVFAHEFCETPMTYLGYDEQGHEFKCAAEPGECSHATLCQQSRYIPVDSGLFGQIPELVNHVGELRDLRKHLERGNNLLKHREGLEPLRVHSLQGVSAVATFATIATLLIEIAGYRKTPKKERPQLELPLAEAA